jgi:hypothetical protein
MAANDRNAYEMLNQMLDMFDLGSLTATAWAYMQDGVPVDDLFLHLYDHPTFKKRFPAMELRRNAGLPPLSPQEYVAMEGEYQQLMRHAGLPKGFYDRSSDYTALLAGNVSPAELAQRIDEGYLAVASAPPQVRAAFKAYYGASSDAALAAIFLDPNKATPALIEMAETAAIGGAASMLDFELDQSMAGELHDFGVDFDSALSGFQKLGELEHLFSETVSEARAPQSIEPDRTLTTRIGDRPGAGGPNNLAGTIPGAIPEADPGDLVAEREGLAFVFGTDADLARKVRQRVDARRAAVSGGGGAAYDEGGLGLGTAE